MRAADAAVSPRRRLATRNSGWAKAAARRLAHSHVRPNSVSMAGIAFACVAGVAFWLVPVLAGGARVAALVVAAAAIQLRLLCNLLDGMLAIEEGLGSKTGDIYNDLPDRVADVIILVGAGYAQRDVPYGPPLGWAAAVMAVFTAYVRLLGGSLGAPQYFIGPMAKQHRMFTLTVATMLSAVEAAFGVPPRAISVGVAVIVAGSIVTVVRRTRRIAREVGAR